MTPVLKLRSPSSPLTVVGGLLLNAFDRPFNRQAALYLTVLSQCILTSGLPVSISNACATGAAIIDMSARAMACATVRCVNSCGHPPVLLVDCFINSPWVVGPPRKRARSKSALAPVNRRKPGHWQAKIRNSWPQQTAQVERLEIRAPERETRHPRRGRRA